jgi:hypothetical protein
MRIKRAWGWPPINLAGTFQREEETIGYILANRDVKTIRIEEIIAHKTRDMKDMMRLIERKYNPVYVFFNLLEGTHGEKIYKRVGFKRSFDTWGVLMIKDIKARKRMRDINKMYGIGEDKFFMTALDMY